MRARNIFLASGIVLAAGCSNNAPQGPVEPRVIHETSNDPGEKLSLGSVIYTGENGKDDIELWAMYGDCALNLTDIGLDQVEEIDAPEMKRFMDDLARFGSEDIIVTRQNIGDAMFSQDEDCIVEHDS